MRRWTPFLLLSLSMSGAFACSDDPAPPAAPALTFAGASWVAPDKDGNLVVQWGRVEGATRYRIYSSVNAGRTLKNLVREVDAAATANGDPAVLVPSTKGARHFAIVRAVDARGVEDVNVVERSAVASPDATPPQFTGVKVVTGQPNAGVTVTWDAAADDASPPEALTYDVFGGASLDRLALLGRTKAGERTFTASALGVPSAPFVFAVYARDVADNVSGDPSPLTAALGPDATAPAFAGCSDVAEIGAKGATVSWNPGTDDVTAGSAIGYEIFLAEASKGQDFTKPFAKVQGDTKVVLDGLAPGKSYYLVCRARDATGNLDPNTAEKAFVTPNDGTAPVFAGVDAVNVDGLARTATLTWTAATDDQTPPGAIVYDIYEKSSGPFAFAAPPKLTTAPGTTTIQLTNLTPRETLTWVVRARDAAKNRDGNEKELSGDVLTSFSMNVQPIFTKSCAVVGCHVSVVEASGLNLSPGFAYAELYGVNSGKPATKRVSNVLGEPLSASYLYEKIVSPTPFRGAQMPAPQTGNALTQTEKDIITAWILEGAPNN